MNYTDQPMKWKNALAYNLTVSMELAILDCEAMGLEIEKVEFDGKFKPRIFVKDCSQTQQFLQEGKAQHFGSRTKHGRRHYLIQMPSGNCKILWETDRLH